MTDKIKEYQKAYREANLEKSKEYQKAYREANREKLKENQRKLREQKTGKPFKGKSGKRKYPERSKVPVMKRRFLFLDGEGYDGKYVVLADSDGRVISNKRGLSTEECFQFLCGCDVDTNRVWYGMTYDVNMMLRDLDPVHLSVLRSKGVVNFKGWTIGWKARRIFTLSKKCRACGFECEHTLRHSSTDVFGFFQQSFEKALQKYKIPYGDILTVGKEQRSIFSTWKLEALIEYNAEELRAGVLLMEALRTALVDANLSVSSWHGPGAIAQAELRRLGADAFYGAPPPHVLEAGERAFFGGRIDTAIIGEVDCHEYDINSAYPWAMCQVPDLSSVTWPKWIASKDGRLPPYQENEFGYIHVSWVVGEDIHPPFPFRTEQGTIIYPPFGEGVYHVIEVRAAIARFPNKIRVLRHCLIYPKQYPMERVIVEAYNLRREAKKNGRPAEAGYKLFLNSLYGKTAQRVGAKEIGGALIMPRYHCVHWAGYITAATRARMSEVLYTFGAENVYSIATDAVFVNPACVLPNGHYLGDWEQTKTARLIHSGYPGIYDKLDADGNSLETKRRGFSGNLDVREAIQRFARGDKMYSYANHFVDYVQCLIRDNWHEWRTFKQERRELHAFDPKDHEKTPKQKRRIEGYPAPGKMRYLAPMGLTSSMPIMSARYKKALSPDIWGDDIPLILEEDIF